MLRGRVCGQLADRLPFNSGLESEFSMGKLDGKVVLVTGAARGQGEAEARLFTAEGARVVLGDVRDAEGQAVAESLGASACYLHHDVSDPQSWARLVTQARQRFGRVDGLVNNAGILLPMISLLDMKLEQYRKLIDVNQVGTFLGVQAVARALVEAGGGGSIVNIGSTAALRGYALCIGYNDSKFAVRGITRTAAIELSRHKIRVNVIHPGYIDTVMGRGTEIGEDWTGQIPNIPLGRYGQPIEIARLALFLLSDDASYCTGAEFLADGGELA